MNKTILFIASGVCILGLVGCVPHYHDYNYDGYERHAPPPPKHKPAPAEKYHIIKSHKVAPKAHIPPKPAPKAHIPPKPAPKAHILPKPAPKAHIPPKPAPKAHIPPKPAPKAHIPPKPAPKAHILPKPAPKAHILPKPAPKLKPHDKKYDNKPASRPPRDERGHRR